MKKLFVLFLMLPSFSWAALPALKYKNVECKLSVDGKLVKTQRQQMMTLIIEDSLGRFAQIQFGDEKQKIQYQLLIENDVVMADGVLVLQNLMIDTLESSSEFSAKDATWVRLGQGAYSVSCVLME